MENENIINVRRNQFIDYLKYIKGNEEIELNILIKQKKVSTDDLTDGQIERMITYYEEQNQLKKQQLEKLKKELVY